MGARRATRTSSVVGRGLLSLRRKCWPEPFDYCFTESMLWRRAFVIRVNREQSQPYPTTFTYVACCDVAMSLQPVVQLLEKQETSISSECKEPLSNRFRNMECFHLSPKSLWLRRAVPPPQNLRQGRTCVTEKKCNRFESGHVNAVGIEERIHQVISPVLQPPNVPIP